MERKEYERVSPESLGIPSKSIQDMVDRLEKVTEMHSIMIQRHGKICAEGWWAPYAPGIPHGLQSLTKTYASTAVGIAFTRGELSLDEKLVDLFPEYLLESVDENLRKLTIYHVLSMTNGMDECNLGGADWINKYFAAPVNHEPGTQFFYNTAGSGMLGVIIKRKTGRSLEQYLKEELFDKIGIDHKHIKWIRTPDGYEVAGGGMLATTEDNLRLMDLYRKDGIWEGERILSHDFVELATTKRIETRGFSPNCDEAVDHLLGYGFQIWMCQPEGSYRADGAFGQYSIVFPKQDLIISLTETTRKEDDGAQYPLDAIYPILDEIRDEALELNEEDWGKLKNKMRSLALPNPPFRPYSPVMEKIQDSRWVTKNGEFFYTPYHRDLLAGKEIPCSILELQLKFVDGGLNLSLQTECGEEFISVPMDGSRGYFVAPYREIPFRKVYSHGYWESEDILCLNFRWIESAYEKTIRMQFDDPFMNIFSEDLISFINLPCEDAVAVRE